jgi:hypothetical protein
MEILAIRETDNTIDGDALELDVVYDGMSSNTGGDV